MDEFEQALVCLKEDHPESFEKFMEWYADALELDIDEFKKLYDENAGYEESDRWEYLGVFRSGRCGRCFDHGMKFDVVLDPEMVKIINEWEKPREADN